MAGVTPTEAERTVEAALTERIAREEILPRVDADLIARHRENPAGPHGDDLQRVLAFLGRRPAAGAEVIAMDPPHGEWVIARLPEERGGRVELTDERFDTQRAAQHAVFRRRLEALFERYADRDLSEVVPDGGAGSDGGRGPDGDGTDGADGTDGGDDG